MRRAVIALLGLLPSATVPAAAQSVVQLHVAYDTYAVGIEVMQMQGFVGLGPWNYLIDFEYHTTGLAWMLYGGQQTNTVRGMWDEGVPRPLEFFGEGVWRGKERRTLIDYDDGQPRIKTLIPPNDTERETVPDALRARTVDTLSALAQLVRKVEDSGTCETTARMFDGRRLVEVSARTSGEETLDPTGRSIYSGKALRCDFEGRQLAGFLSGDDDAQHRAPLHGSAWLASLRPGGPRLPVRIAFETRWFGWTTMYLTSASEGPTQAQAGNSARD